jgi:hypothetical protein
MMKWPSNIAILWANLIMAVILYAPSYKDKSSSSDDLSSLSIADPLAAEGIYVQESGYLIMLRPNKTYEVCDMTECVTGVLETYHHAHNDSYLYPEVRHSVSLKYLFKTDLGLRLELDTAFDQSYYQRSPERVAEFSKNEQFLRDVIDVRIHAPVDERFDLSAGIGYRFGDKTSPGLIYGLFDRGSANVILKYASF